MDLWEQIVDIPVDTDEAATVLGDIATTLENLMTHLSDLDLPTTHSMRRRATAQALSSCSRCEAQLGAYLERFGDPRVRPVSSGIDQIARRLSTELHAMTGGQA